MELHSYAKRRVTPKKWTIEQKRKLVQARIANESLFASKPRGSLMPWKKVLSITNLDDYNVFFVRRQWSNMVGKYKQYKQNRLGNIPTQAIDDEMIRKISQEWEFFAPIHEYMMLKTRNLHSYAQRQQHHQEEEEPILELNSNSNSTLSSTEFINIYSSDTNDIPLPMTSIKREFSEITATQNTDHDFYSKKWEEQQQQQQQSRSHYFADASEDTQESSAMMEMKMDNEESATAINSSSINEIVVTSSQQQQQPSVVPMEVQQPEKPSTSKRKRLTERDRYYRHKRRFNRRFERRFDAILQVMGQVVKAEYPSIDVSPLMQVANAALDLGGNFSGQIFSSGEDEYEEEASEEEERKKVATNSTAAQTEQSHWYLPPK